MYWFTVFEPELLTCNKFKFCNFIGRFYLFRFFMKMLNRSFELCLKTYGEKHMLMLRLYLNIGILYEDNRDYQKAYDYFVKWHETCLEVSAAFTKTNTKLLRKEETHGADGDFILQKLF